jgi:hypothetical protein
MKETAHDPQIDVRVSKKICRPSGYSGKDILAASTLGELPVEFKPSAQSNFATLCSAPEGGLWQVCKLVFTSCGCQRQHRPVLYTAQPLHPAKLTTKKMRSPAYPDQDSLNA